MELRPLSQDLLADLESLIQQSKHQLATAANATLTYLYWHIGRRINQDVLANERAQFAQAFPDEQIVSTA